MAAPQTSTQELRKFGLAVGIALAVVFGALLPWIFNRAYPTWPWIAGGVLVALALVVPRALEWPHRGWMIVGHALGWFNTRVILSVLFFVLVVPVGLLMRALGRGTMRGGREPQATSYRIPSARSADPKAMEKPF
jgi:hypothetical protein